jgi:hypothetical protein
VIRSVDPGSAEVPRGTSIKVTAELGGFRPEGVRLLYRPRGQDDWHPSKMVRDGEAYSRTLNLLVRRTEYRIVAGDEDALDEMARGSRLAESPVFTLTPIEEPRVESIRVLVTPPEYSGVAPEELPEGTGDVRALEGSGIEVTITANRAVVEGELELELGKGGKKSSVPFEAVPAGSEGGPDDPEAGRRLRARFTLDKSGEYGVRLVDKRGKENTDRAVYRLTAIPDKPPRVKITRPGPEQSIRRDKEVKVEIEATDDVGLAEVGIVHTLRGEAARTPVQRPKKGTKSAKKSEVEFPMRLALQGYKGGEIITYYAYAVDAKGTESKGEVHFLHTFDEERYGMPMGQMKKRQPKSVKEVQKFIERQQRVMRDTFGLSAARARRRDDAGDGDKKEAESAARSQERLGRDVSDFVKGIEEALAREGAEAPGMRPKEIEHLKSATGKMDEATKSIRADSLDPAFASQSEALSHLSRTRRLILSESGEGAMSTAMNRANRKRKSERQARRRKQLDEFQQEMTKLPPIIEQEEKARRRLEELEDRPPPPAQAQGMADEERRLAEAKEALARKLQEMAREDPGMPQEPQRRLAESAEENRRAADEMERGRPREAARAAKRASKQSSAAQRSGSQAMSSMRRERARAAASSAEDLAGRQRGLQRETEKASKAAEGQPSKSKADALAAGQDELARDHKDLMDEVKSLTESARREGRPDAEELAAELAEAERRQELWGTGRRMKDAADMLREGRSDDATTEQRSSAMSLDGLASDLRDAWQKAKSRRGGASRPRARSRGRC